MTTTRHIVLGEFLVSDERELVISTTVGSCVAACLFDPERKIGGMNHFFLPRAPDAARAKQDGDRRYGVHLMELLINGLLQRGANRYRLYAKAFGGARITQGLTDAGPRNADFIEWFLRHEGIALVGGSLRGDRGRRVQIWPATGRARQMLCDIVEHPVADLGLTLSRGNVELF